MSEGTLRYLLCIAALLSPRPPVLMVLNKPETSFCPDLLPALARLIIGASRESQIVVVSHSTRLVIAPEQEGGGMTMCLEAEFGETLVRGVHSLEQPAWRWPRRWLHLPPARAAAKTPSHIAIVHCRKHT